MNGKVGILFFGVASLVSADSIAIFSNEFYQDSLAEDLLTVPSSWPPVEQGIGGAGAGGVVPLSANSWQQMNPYLVVTNPQNTLEGFLLEEHPGEVIWEGVPEAAPPLVTFSFGPPTPSPPPLPPPPRRPRPTHKAPQPVPTPEPGYVLPLAFGLVLGFARHFWVRLKPKGD